MGLLLYGRFAWYPSTATHDTSIQTLASLASMRSNCMKRRVGAILVRNKRIVATGYIYPLYLHVSIHYHITFCFSYNGTPLGLTNCNEGGCARCNGLQERESCLCLHAEENALLEAGRERVSGATLYCNTSAQKFFFYILLSEIAGVHVSPVL